jgi:hypothetical protein
VPYKSKAQMKKFFVMEREGELPKGTAEEWAHHTKDLKSLPEHVSEKKGFAMTVLSTLAAAAADRTLVEKLAEDSGFAARAGRGPGREDREPAARRLRQAGVRRPGRLRRPAEAGDRQSGKLTRAWRRRPNLVLRMLGNAAKHMGKGLGNAAEAATGKDTNVGRAAVGGLAASGAGLGASGAAKMMGGAAAKANPAAQAAGPGGSAGSGGGAQNAPSPAASSSSRRSSPRSRPRRPRSPKPGGIGLGGAAAIGAGGAAVGAGGAMLAGRRKKQQQPSSRRRPRTSSSPPWAGGREEGGANSSGCEAATGLCRYLDVVAAKMPLEKSASVRVLQAEVGRGRDLVDAVKVAYPTLSGEQRGVLAYEIVKTAHDWLKAAEFGSGGTMKVRRKQEYSGKDFAEGMKKTAGIGEALLKIMKQRGAMGVLGAGAMGAAGGSMASNALTGVKAPSVSMPSAANLPKAPQVANPMTNVNKALGGR